MMKIVSAFEDNVPAHQLRILPEPGAQTHYIACVQKVDGPAKYGVFDSLVVWQI